VGLIWQVKCFKSLILTPFFDFPINYYAARVNGSAPFNVSFMLWNGTRPDNSQVTVGYCGQSWRNRKLAISTSVCWTAGTKEEGCGGLGPANYDYFSGNITFNYSAASNNAYSLSIVGAQGLYLAAIGERPGIDVICSQN